MLPTTYLGPSAWYEAFFAARRANEQVLIEVQESFVKQTYRNRCLIHDAQGHEVILTVPVLKVEHKQLTRDVQISYQQHWQHQHWMALKSAYGKSPYWDYYADCFAPFYERETKWLIDLNDGLHEVIVSLLGNRPPSAERRKTASSTPLHVTCGDPAALKEERLPCGMREQGIAYTEQFMQADLEPYWGNGTSILDALMDRGPETFNI